MVALRTLTWMEDPLAGLARSRNCATLESLIELWYRRSQSPWEINQSPSTTLAIADPHAVVSSFSEDTVQLPPRGFELQEFVPH